MAKKRDYTALTAALSSLADYTPMQVPPTKFQSYMASPSSPQGFGFASTGKQANQVGQEHSFKSSVLETFKWLMTPGTLMQQGLMNNMDVAGENIKDAFQGNFEFGNLVDDWKTKSLPNNLKALGGAVSELAEPAAQVAMIPGIELPFERGIEEKMDKQQDNLFYRDYSNAPFDSDEGVKPVQGANIVDNYMGVDNKWAKGIGGFALDVATDPLTFAGGLGAGRVLTQKLVPGLFKSVDEKLAESAAGLTTPTRSLTTEAPEAFTPPPVEPGFKLPQTSLADSSVESMGLSKAPGSAFGGLTNPLPKIDIPQTPAMQGLAQGVSPTAENMQPVLQGLPDIIKGMTKAGFKDASATIAKAVYHPADNLVDVMGNLIKAPVGRATRAQRLGATSGNLLSKDGVNPFVVSNTLTDANIARASQGKPVYNAVPAATGEVQKVATNVAELFSKNALKSAELSPRSQAQLYKHILNTKTAKANPSLALSMLKSAEDRLISKGIKTTAWSGQGLRLSEVIGAAGIEHAPAILKAFTSNKIPAVIDKEVSGLIGQLQAARAVQTGAVAEMMFNRAEPLIRKALEEASPTSFAKLREATAQQVYNEARDIQGLTSAEASKVRDLVKNYTGIEEVGSWELFHTVETVTPKLAKALLQVDRGRAMTKEIEKSISLMRKAVSKEVDQAAGKITAQTLANRVQTFTMQNMTTWLGRGAMFNMLRAELSPIQSAAKMYAGWFSNIAKSHTPVEISNAFRMAQQMGADDMAAGLMGTAKEQELARKFLDYFENTWASNRQLFDSKSGKIKDLTDTAGTVAFRSGAVMEDVNRQLKALGSKFQFRNGGDYKDWRTSWQNYNPQKDIGANPLLFMYNINVAMQRVMAEYNVMDSFVETFGRKVGDAGYDATTHTHEFHFGNRVTDDIKFPKQERDQFVKLLEDYEKGPWRPESKVMKVMTSGLRKWKSAVTIYYPSHHIRNLVGDSYLMWSSGIDDPRIFGKSMKILKSQRSRYGDILKSEDINDIQKFLDGDYAVKNESRQIVSNKFKARISADEYYGEAFKRGLLLDADRIEDIYGENFTAFNPQKASPLGKLSTVGKGIHGQASKISEVREHYVRIAHMVGYVEKHMDSKLGHALARTNDPIKRAELLKPLMDRAAEQIRKWHPDGTDMSYFEQKWMRNIMPFYSWQRKAVPLVIEGMFMNPGKMTAYPKGMAALQQITGIETAGGPYDPFPQDQLFPDWITNSGVGPIGDAESENAWAKWIGRLGVNAVDPTGEEYGYTMVDPGRLGLPANSLIADYTGGETLHGLAGSTNPLFQIAGQGMLGVTGTGAPISKEEGGEGYGSWATSQVPFVNTAQSMLGFGKDYQETREPGFNSESLINRLTAAGITGTGKYIKSAEFQERNRKSQETKALYDELRKQGVIQ